MAVGNFSGTSGNTAVYRFDNSGNPVVGFGTNGLVETFGCYPIEELIYDSAMDDLLLLHLADGDCSGNDIQRLDATTGAEEDRGGDGDFYAFAMTVDGSGRLLLAESDCLGSMQRFGSDLAPDTTFGQVTRLRRFASEFADSFSPLR